MGRRLFRGRTFSENGWPYVDQGSCTWIKVPGAEHVSLQIQNGVPLTILRAFAADYHANVEPLRDPDSSCWTQDNSVSSSNHPGGTCYDLNWNGPDGKTFRLGISKAKAFPGAMARELELLYDFYESPFHGANGGIMFCGGLWGIQDWMHHQLRAGTYDQKNDRPMPFVQDFINRKIRPDGLSTYRRSGAVTPPVIPSPIVVPAATTILARACGITQAKAESIFPQVSFALTKANCTNPRRIAAALAQWIIESGHFVYTEEIASGPETQERWKYKGRTWVQLTWLENYRGFSRWAHSLGLVPSPTHFVDHPKQLAEQKWAALGPAYWWAIKYPQINEYADRGDIDNVSKWVNAPAWVDNPNKHANHEAERRAAYNKALALGDQLLQLIQTQTGDDDLSANAERILVALEDALLKPTDSFSLLKKPGEGKIAPLTRFLKYMDANTHVPFMKLMAELGQPEALADLKEIADADLVKFPDAAKGQAVARKILNEVAAAKAIPVAVQAVVSAPVPAAVSPSAAPAYDDQALIAAVTAAIRDTMMSIEPKVVYVDTPAAEEVSQPRHLAENPASTGDQIGNLFKALQEMRLNEKLNPADAATLSALMIVLKPTIEGE